MTTPPSAPYGRLTGRWTDPTGAPARGVVRIAPDPDYVAVTLHDGRAMVVRTATVKLDDTGALAADVVAPGDGVVPAGPWTYTVSVSLSGGWTRTVKAQAVQGQPIDLVAVMGTPGNPGAADLSARLAALEARVNGGAGGSGIAGPAGPIGPRGEPGPAGPQGPAGERGPEGRPGPTGAPGAKGEPGPAGERGPVGPAGPEGPAPDLGAYLRRSDAEDIYATKTALAAAQLGGGDTSPDLSGYATKEDLKAIQSTPGPAGPAGERGPAGPPGPAGETGPRGETGPAGPAGEQGQPGPAGPTGPAGPAGKDGAAGPAGAPGQRGPQGPAGERGPAGPAGAGADPAELEAIKKRLDQIEARPPILVLGREDMVPDGTAPGTIIIRKEA